MCFFEFEKGRNADCLTTNGTGTTRVQRILALIKIIGGSRQRAQLEDLKAMTITSFLALLPLYILNELRWADTHQHLSTRPWGNAGWDDARNCEAEAWQLRLKSFVLLSERSDALTSSLLYFAKTKSWTSDKSAFISQTGWSDYWLKPWRLLHPIVTHGAHPWWVIKWC